MVVALIVRVFRMDLLLRNHYWIGSNVEDKLHMLRRIKGIQSYNNTNKYIYETRQTQQFF